MQYGQIHSQVVFKLDDSQLIHNIFGAQFSNSTFILFSLWLKICISMYWISKINHSDIFVEWKSHLIIVLIYLKYVSDLFELKFDIFFADLFPNN